MKILRILLAIICFPIFYIFCYVYGIQSTVVRSITNIIMSFGIGSVLAILSIVWQPIFGLFTSFIIALNASIAIVKGDSISSPKNKNGNADADEECYNSDIIDE